MVYQIILLFYLLKFGHSVFIYFVPLNKNTANNIYCDNPKCVIYLFLYDKVGTLGHDFRNLYNQYIIEKIKKSPKPFWALLIF